MVNEARWWSNCSRVGGGISPLRRGCLALSCAEMAGLAGSLVPMERRAEVAFLM